MCLLPKFVCAGMGVRVGGPSTRWCGVGGGGGGGGGRTDMVES